MASLPAGCVDSTATLKLHRLSAAASRRCCELSATVCAARVFGTAPITQHDRAQGVALRCCVGGGLRPLQHARCPLDGFEATTVFILFCPSRWRHESKPRRPRPANGSRAVRSTRTGRGRGVRETARWSVSRPAKGEDHAAARQLPQRREPPAGARAPRMRALPRPRPCLRPAIHAHATF
eukprot:366342-Chlamydomonas_euryale.AAC.6